MKTDLQRWEDALTTYYAQKKTLEQSRAKMVEMGLTNLYNDLYKQNEKLHSQISDAIEPESRCNHMGKCLGGL